MENFLGVSEICPFAAGSMRSFLSASSSGSRVPASLKSTERSSWSASARSSRMPDSASLRWSAASTSWRASSPRLSNRLFSRMRRCYSQPLQILSYLLIKSCSRVGADVCFAFFPSKLQVNEGDGEDTDLQIFCVSCSHPVNPKVALRHMERCYAKVILPFILFSLWTLIEE